MAVFSLFNIFLIKLNSWRKVANGVNMQRLPMFLLIFFCKWNLSIKDRLYMFNLSEVLIFWQDECIHAWFLLFPTTSLSPYSTHSSTVVNNTWSRTGSRVSAATFPVWLMCCRAGMTALSHDPGNLTHISHCHLGQGTGPGERWYVPERQRAPKEEGMWAKKLWSDPDHRDSPEALKSVR